ncbi:MAG: hypothetical protein PVS3B3_14530 [Ktedonobacteraceae bacterium]
MVFCGQCGFHLPSGITRCPRCGTVADTASDAGVDTFPSDAPTVESLTYPQRPQVSIYPDTPYASIPFTPPEPHKLVLRPGNNGDAGYGMPEDNEPTSALNAPDYQTRTPFDFQTNQSYQSVPDNISHPGQANIIYQNGGYTPANYAYTGQVPPERAVPVSYPLASPTQQRKGRTIPILIALLCFLLILGASSFFVIKRFHLLDPTGSVNSGSTTPAGPIEQAKAVVQRYYTDINNKKYQEAYNLWKWDANAPSFATFAAGYANTERDDLTIKGATKQPDGTVKVALTIVATERINGGTQQHTYTGYYIVGQDVGTWKILRGILNRI